MKGFQFTFSYLGTTLVVLHGLEVCRAGYHSVSYLYEICTQYLCKLNSNFEPTFIRSTQLTCGIVLAACIGASSSTVGSTGLTTAPAPGFATTGATTGIPVTTVGSRGMGTETTTGAGATAETAAEGEGTTAVAGTTVVWAEAAVLRRL